MSDMDVLSRMIRDTALERPFKEYGKSCVQLKESQTQDSVVKIHNLPDDAIVIKVDDFRSPDSIFKGENGECSRADYAIISAEKKCILYIEMKREKDGRDHIVKQLKGAQCFIRYCQEIGRAFWSEDSFMIGYKSRFISIGHTNIVKKKTRVLRETKRHDTPENAMKIDWPHHLQFNHLAN